MTLCYFEPFNGKLAIVERVPECQARCGSYRLRTHGEESWAWYGTITRDVRLADVDDELAAALTRDAIIRWFMASDGYAFLQQIGDRGFCTQDIQESVNTSLDYSINAAAHSRADALEDKGGKNA